MKKELTKYFTWIGPGPGARADPEDIDETERWNFYTYEGFSSNFENARGRRNSSRKGLQLFLDLLRSSA